jgi:S1-C subfamily serine protease
MMTNEMQDYRPNDPPPPPPAEPVGGYYSPWSADPTWGPPTWPPSQQAKSGTGFRRTALAVFAIACVGAGGGTAWALTTTSASSPSTASQGSGSTGTGQNPGGNGTAPSTGAISAATVAQIDSAVVDITADTAGGQGEVAGTGMIITSNGEVLTNNHVIDDTVNIRAQIDGTGTVYTVKVIGYDANDDVALVQLENASGLPTIPIGDSSTLGAGDAITVLGNALGKGGTPAEVTGTVADLDQQITASDDSDDTETLTGMIEVSAAIEPGDSGGPEINSAGKVIGMTTAGQTSGNPGREAASSIGFAIPINKAMQIITEIRAGGGEHIHIGYAALLGVEVSTAEPDTQPNCTTSEASTGAWVSVVEPNSPASGTGLAACGRIIGIGGVSVANQNDLHNAMEGFVAGQTVTLTWMDSSAQTHSATITLGTATFPD